MRISEIFNLGLTQPYLDFLDIDIETDLLVFVDPTALRNLKSPWGHDCAALVQNYFEVVLDKIKSGDHETAKDLLASLNERNEFHLGYSKGKSRGHAFGPHSASLVWEALCKSQASISGLLQDLEDTALMIEGIGKDMISDAVCNIIKAPLIKYTQDMCIYYNIPLTPNLDSGPVWNIEKQNWEHKFVSLPLTADGKLILIPKIIVRKKIAYDYQDYYHHYLLPVMQHEEILKNSSLVRYLKDGTPKVTKKSLKEKYGDNKLSVIDETLKRPEILDKYREEKTNNPSDPLKHENLSEIEGFEFELPNWDDLIKELKLIPVGKDHASAYEKAIEKIFSALFYPNLVNPIKQHPIHDGRKRIDITYSNESKFGFFNWLSMHYSSAFIFVECKNYGKELGNPEIDQLAGRFSPSRGKVGILVCRSVEDKLRLKKRCIDTAKDDRGYIIALTDEDIEDLINNYVKDGLLNRKFSFNYSLLKKKFSELIS